MNTIKHHFCVSCGEKILWGRICYTCLIEDKAAASSERVNRNRWYLPLHARIKEKFCNFCGARLDEKKNCRACNKKLAEKLTDSGAFSDFMKKTVE